jgi:integrase
MPIELASWTGQRQGDLLKPPWSAHDGGSIRLKQGKSKKYVEIPVRTPLKVLLDAMKPEKATGAILRNSYGESWTSDGFRASWSDRKKRAGMADVDLHFHDLRGAAATNLAVAGCPIPEIASITGHSPDEAAKILAAHYLGADRRLAAGAMKKLEEFRAGSIANRFANPASTTAISVGSQQKPIDFNGPLW